MKHTLFLLIFATLIAGCHTVKGVGEDVSATGDAVQRASGEKS